MALLVCTGCSTAYSVGAPRCPHCLSTVYEEDHPMPKITVHGGPSNDAEDNTPVDDVPAETPEEEPSPGNSSETSSEKPSASPKKSASAARSHARTTENPS